MTDRVAPLPAVGRFRDTTDRYQGGASTPNGSTTMTRIFVGRLLRRTLGGSTVINTIWCNTSDPSANGGWRLQYQPAVPDFRFQISDGTGNTRSVTFPVTSAFFGGYLLIICTYNETSLVMRIRGAEVSTGPFVGFTAPTQNLTLGASPGGTLPAENLAAACMLDSDTVALDAAGRAAAQLSIQDDLEQGRFVTLAAGFDEHYWDSRDAVTGPGTPIVFWRDRVANVLLGRQGAGLEGYGYAADFG